MKTRQPSVQRRKPGRPTLEETTANPYSRENIRHALFISGFDLAEHLKTVKQKLAQIEDPKDFIQASNAISQTYLPYVARKQSDDQASQVHSGTTIQIVSFSDAQQQKVIDSMTANADKPVIEISPSPASLP